MDRKTSEVLVDKVDFVRYYHTYLSTLRTHREGLRRRYISGYLALLDT